MIGPEVEMSRKNRKNDDLDMETSFADMNVEGFKWYNPHKKKDGDNKVNRPVSRKEYWQMVRGAFAAYLPMFIVVILSFGAVVALAYLWLS